MGLMDKVMGMLKGNSDKVKGGLDKAGEMIDDKTGGKFGDKIEMATDKAGEMLGADADADAEAGEAE